MPTVEQEHLPATLGAAVDARAQRLDREGFSARLYAGDADLWAIAASDRESISARLGWLQLPGSMLEVEWPAARSGSVLLVGMGGSNLAAKACATAFGMDRLRVVDSTLPAVLTGLVRTVELAGSTVILASKSGTTVETAALADWLLDEASRAGATIELLAITDAGTELQARVEQLGGQVWCNPENVGGRFSALSYFGLLPAALAGVPVSTLVERAVEAESRRGSAADPSIRLGIVLAEAAAVGRDKLTLLTSPRLASFAEWIEQLVAESTGKRGKGLVPITREPALIEPAGADRLFVIVDGFDAADSDRTKRIGEALAAAGHPVIRHTLSSPADLGAEFLRWQIAVAAAGALLEINPFDEPDVAASKVRTQHLLDRGLEGPRQPDDSPRFDERQPSLCLAVQSVADPSDAAVLWQWLARRSAKAVDGYCALLAFLPDAEPIKTRLDEIRGLIAARFGLATTLGWGPGYLHSTGQLHKGGPPTGVFLVLTADDADDVDIPGRPYTFGTLALAQARGDVDALRERQRPVVRVHLRAPTTGSLEAVIDSLRSSPLNPRR